MAPIKNIVSDVASSERLRQQERVSSTRSEKAKKQGSTKESAPAEPRKDKVDISSTARELAESRRSDMARYQEMLGALKSEDGEKLANVQERIAQGAYEEPAVLERVAESIANLPQFRALAEGAPESREVQGDIAARIRRGEYDSEEVLERVAINILRDIGAS